MGRRMWLFVTAGTFALLAGVLVFFHPLDAKPKKDSGDPAARKAGPFDGERAVAHVTTICDLGPRISGSEAMTKQRELARKHFEKTGATITLQKFDGKQPSQKNTVPMVNVMASWHPDRKARVMVCGHYDTRPIADQETNVRDWTKPFASANDGASSVAFLMELSQHVKDLRTEVGIDFVLFDGEEWIHDRQNDRFFLGSDHFAAEYKKVKDGPKYKGAILLDLFAGKGATYPVEENSRLLAGPLVEDFWKLAADLGAGPGCAGRSLGPEPGRDPGH
jgi:glutaminyl-peptide cyclotransferase